MLSRSLCKFTKPIINVREITITKGVEFEHIAREWRMKWSADNDKESLSKIQTVLEKHLPQIKSVDGLISVQRVVCGGCLDYKVVMKLPAAKFQAWGDLKFSPEECFLKGVKDIPGVSVVETQTYTLETV